MARNFTFLFLGISLILFLTITNTQAQYTVTTGSSANELVNELVGEGVEIISTSLICAPEARGIFNGTGDLGIDSGIVLTSGTANVFGNFTSWFNPAVYNALGGT